MEKGFRYLVFILLIFLILMCFLYHKTSTQQQEKRNFNKYIRKFWIQYVIVMPILVLLEPSKYLGDSLAHIFQWLFFLFMSAVIYALSLIKKNKVLNLVYFILVLTEIIFVVLYVQSSMSSYTTYYKFDYHFSYTSYEVILWFDILSFFLSFFFSFFIYIYLKKKDKVISLWGLVFNFEFLFLYLVTYIFSLIDRL
jgi:hypothetical protein